MAVVMRIRSCIHNILCVCGLCSCCWCHSDARHILQPLILNYTTVVCIQHIHRFICLNNCNVDATHRKQNPFSFYRNCSSSSVECKERTRAQSHYNLFARQIMHTHTQQHCAICCELYAYKTCGVLFLYIFG